MYAFSVDGKSNVYTVVNNQRHTVAFCNGMNFFCNVNIFAGRLILFAKLQESCAALKRLFYSVCKFLLGKWGAVCYKI